MVELGDHCLHHTSSRLTERSSTARTTAASPSSRVEGRRRLPHLPPRPVLDEEGHVGPVGRQPGLQRRDARRGPLQARGLHLRPLRRALLDARPLHGVGLRLRHHADAHRRPAPVHRRRGRPGPHAPRPLRGLARRRDGLPEPHAEEDPQRRPRPLRVGPRRLQPQRRRAS